VSAALIWCPFASEEDAARSAAQLLDEGLIACANLLPVRSLFVWRGERWDARECAALMKTDAALLDRAVARLAAIHPYETPAIAGWRADAVPPTTAAWLGQLV
jgi:periplasmic divalent cation tolerance protein